MSPPNNKRSADDDGSGIGGHKRMRSLNPQSDQMLNSLNPGSFSPPIKQEQLNVRHAPEMSQDEREGLEIVQLLDLVGLSIESINDRFSEFKITMACQCLGLTEIGTKEALARNLFNKLQELGEFATVVATVEREIPTRSTSKSFTPHVKQRPARTETEPIASSNGQYGGNKQLTDLERSMHDTITIIEEWILHAQRVFRESHEQAQQIVASDPSKSHLELDITKQFRNTLSAIEDFISQLRSAGRANTANPPLDSVEQVANTLIIDVNNAYSLDDRRSLMMAA